MEKSNLYVGNTKLHFNIDDVTLESITINDERYYKIENYDQMDPFFMTIVSDVDFWMFISSTGGLTAGRKNPESALFPYYTDDKIHDSFETTGSHTAFIVSKDGKKFLWKPFDNSHKTIYKTSYNLYKNVTGNKIMFESINHDLGVTYRYSYKTSDQFGIVKTSELMNDSKQACNIRLLDGIRNILPYGVNTLIQTTKSTLVDGYKRCELLEDGIGLYTLSSIIIDKAEPSESLKATSVWSVGLTCPTILLSEQQVQNFYMDKSVIREDDVKGRRGSYYVSTDLELKESQSKEWSIISEVNQSASDIELLKLAMQGDILSDLNQDILRGDYKLNALVHEADGFQLTSNEKTVHRHFSNVLYNIMRGGIYADGYKIVKDDLIDFIKSWNQQVYLRHQEYLDQLDAIVDYSDLKNRIDLLDDPDLERLILEYLPLTYSRRHGDPSRPWNKFNIEVSKEGGEQKLNFEGNWRDIFQNWEALSMSYPAYIESIISKFVNASTPDGYNPYRITKSGIDWEMLDPEDPWSNIGYWGDHQVIYLLKLMELSKKYSGHKIIDLLPKEIFTYANVPYIIKDLNSVIKDPRNTILFDDERQASIDERVNKLGADGKLVFIKDNIYRVNLMEKLLVTMLSKLANYVPEGGIWMNTQRPEWNDANNALVGNGISMVTLYYLYRYQNFMLELIETLDGDSLVSIELKEMFDSMFHIFSQHKACLNHPISDEVRYTFVTQLGSVGDKYRQGIYSSGFSGQKASLSYKELRDFLVVSMAHLEDTIKKNRRDDGLYNSYNLIRFDHQSCGVSYLYEMLEGQVAVISSGVLDLDQTLDILESLRKSDLYRQDQNSYLLYPNRDLPMFMDKNIIPDEIVASSKLLMNELEQARTRFIEKDINGLYHFNTRFRNSEELVEAIMMTNDYSEDEATSVGDMFSDLFNHYAFTGRSGTFYKYEGLGCIYWHMVSKLVLSVEESFNRYSKTGIDEKVFKLGHYYHDLKAGVGVDKSPENYGAFPTDAYSHTPGFAGVQQPGMTGQVKEDIISRFGELGVIVESGQVCFRPILLKYDEFLNESKVWKLPEASLNLEKGQLGFTLCKVPVIYSLSDHQAITVYYLNGDTYKFENTCKMDEFISSSLFNRHEKIEKIIVDIDRDQLLY